MQMNTELIFRIFLSTQIVVILGIRKYYQRQSSESKKQGVVCDRDTAIAIVVPSFLLTVSMIAAIVYVIHPPWIRWSTVTLWPGFRWLGVATVAMGVVLLFWCQYELGKNFFGGMKIRDGHQLVVSGPYRYVRHPMYTAFIVIGIGFFLVTSSWIVVLPWLFGTVWVLWSRFGQEEQMLSDEFGEAYDEYRKRTGRLIPKIWRG